MISAEAFDALARRVALLYQRVEGAGLSSLNVHERVLFSVWDAGGQIENGGFDQFFFNSSGDYSSEAPQAFRAIGATGKAAVIDRALALFPDAAPPSDRPKRVEVLDVITQREGEGVFDELDEAFYAVPEDVDSLLEAYVADNDDDIAREPEH